MRSLLTAAATILVFGAITVVLWLGAHSVLDGTMTPGQLGQFLLYAVYVAVAAASLSETWGEVQRAAGAMERLVELQTAEPRIAAPAVPVELPVPGRGHIRFDGVAFSYPSRPETRALDGFTLDIAPGETVAFVGPAVRAPRRTPRARTASAPTCTSAPRTALASTWAEGWTPGAGRTGGRSTATARAKAR